MGLISHDWAEIKTPIYNPLGPNIYRDIWIFSIIRKLCNTDWYICNFRNHNLHATDGPKNGNYSSRQYKSLSTLQRRNPRTLKIFHFLFKTNIHTLLSHPVRKQLYGIAAAYITRQFSQIIPNRMGKLLGTDKLLLIRIHSSRLIPYLTTDYQSPTIRTVVGLDRTLSLFIEREDVPLIYQYPYHV